MAKNKEIVKSCKTVQFMVWNENNSYSAYVNASRKFTVFSQWIRDFILSIRTMQNMDSDICNFVNNFSYEAISKSNENFVVNLKDLTLDPLSSTFSQLNQTPGNGWIDRRATLKHMETEFKKFGLTPEDFKVIYDRDAYPIPGSGEGGISQFCNTLASNFFGNDQKNDGNKQMILASKLREINFFAEMTGEELINQLKEIDSCLDGKNIDPEIIQKASSKNKIPEERQFARNWGCNLGQPPKICAIIDYALRNKSSQMWTKHGIPKQNTKIKDWEQKYQVAVERKKVECLEYWNEAISGREKFSEEVIDSDVKSRICEYFANKINYFFPGLNKENYVQEFATALSVAFASINLRDVNQCLKAEELKKVYDKVLPVDEYPEFSRYLRDFIELTKNSNTIEGEYRIYQRNIKGLSIFLDDIIDKSSCEDPNSGRKFAMRQLLENEPGVWTILFDHIGKFFEPLLIVNGDLAESDHCIDCKNKILDSIQNYINEQEWEFKKKNVKPHVLQLFNEEHPAPIKTATGDNVARTKTAYFRSAQVVMEKGYMWDSLPHHTDSHEVWVKYDREKNLRDNVKKMGLESPSRLKGIEIRLPGDNKKTFMKLFNWNATLAFFTTYDGDLPSVSVNDNFHNPDKLIKPVQLVNPYLDGQYIALTLVNAKKMVKTHDGYKEKYVISANFNLAVEEKNIKSDEKILSFDTGYRSCANIAIIQSNGCVEKVMPIQHTSLARKHNVSIASPIPLTPEEKEEINKMMEKVKIDLSIEKEIPVFRENVSRPKAYAVAANWMKGAKSNKLIDATEYAIKLYEKFRQTNNNRNMQGGLSKDRMDALVKISALFSSILSKAEEIGMDLNQPCFKELMIDREKLGKKKAAVRREMYRFTAKCIILTAREENVGKIIHEKLDGLKGEKGNGTRMNSIVRDMASKKMIEWLEQTANARGYSTMGVEARNTSSLNPFLKRKDGKKFEYIYRFGVEKAGYEKTKHGENDLKRADKVIKSAKKDQNVEWAKKLVKIKNGGFVEEELILPCGEVKTGLVWPRRGGEYVDLGKIGIHKSDDIAAVMIGVRYLHDVKKVINVSTPPHEWTSVE